jgi:hypothetical protein
VGCSLGGGQHFSQERKMESVEVYTKRVYLFVLTCLVAAFLFTAPSSFAQAAGTGTISGTITDPSNAAIAGASVDVLDVDTGIVRTIQTDDSGLYSATFLQPGHYQVTATKEGFGKIEQKDILLEVGHSLTVNLALPVKTTAETVTVTAENPLLEPEKTDLSQTVSQTLAANLPLNGRRWENFALLTPGATTDGSHGLVSYHGISGLFNNSAVDGTSNMQAFFSEDRGRTTVGYTYSLDAIQEFQVTSNSFSAEFGQAAGGVVNAITKSGTNDVHGDVFYYLRYPSLNALDPYSKSQGILTQPEHQRQQFGGSVGGPIIKDKLFFFANYDGQRRSFPIIYTGPTPAALPAVSTANCSAVIGITATQCSAAVNYVLGTIGARPRYGDQDVYLGKLDYQASTNNHLSVSFNFMDWKAPNDYQGNPTYAVSSSGQNGNYITHERFLVAHWNSVLSATMVNDLRFQWSRDLEVYSANASGPSVALGSSSGGIFAYGMPNALPRPAFPDEHRLEFADSISMVHNRHTFKFGVDISPIHELLINLFQGGGIYSYAYNSGNPSTTFQAWLGDLYNLPLSTDSAATRAARVGKHYNTFAQAYDPITGVGKDDFYDVDYGFYGEDTWKARSNVTFNLGLRYDIQWVPQPPRPNTSSALASYATSTLNIDKADIGPRIGIAWQMSKNMVLRGGYGIFYGKTTNSSFYDTRVENGVYQQTYNCNANYQSPTNPGTVSSCAPIFPNVLFPAPGPALAPPIAGAVTPAVQNTSPTASTISFRGQAPDYLEPMVNEANAAVERELPGDMTVSGTYSFSRGQHLPVCDDLNLAPPTSSITYNVIPGPFAGGGTVTVPLFTSRLTTINPIISNCQSIVHSLYNAMILTGRKRLSHDFEFMVNYTLAKTQDDGQVLGDTGTFNGSSDPPLNPYNQELEWGNSDYDQRHRFITSFLWSPRVKSDSRVLRDVVNGFNLSGIVNVSSAFPVNAVFSSSFTPPGGVDAGATGGVEQNASNAAGRIPNFPKNYFRGPTQVRDVDFRIGRDIPLFTERYKLQFSIEAFNLFNHRVNTTVFNSAYAYVAPGATYTPPTGGSAVCPAGSSPCMNPQSSFLTPSATSNSLIGARQLQISGKFFF